LTVDRACRKVGIGESTYDRWKACQENPVSSEYFNIYTYIDI
jgi:hypothetical protein